MAITAVLSNPSPRVVVKQTGVGGAIQTNTPVTLRNTAVITRLDQCLDVDASSEQDGSILVYEAATDKYKVKQLNLPELNASLDGGTF